MSEEMDFEARVPADWERVEPFPGFLREQRFIPHAAPDDRLLLRYYRPRGDGNLKALCWFGPGAGGAPGRVHGGSVSAVLDETLGAAIWITGMPVVTVRLQVKYRNPLRIGSFCVIDTRIDKMRTRRVEVSGTLSVQEGELIAEAAGTYFRLPPAEVSPETEALLRERRV